jgi:diacylglycerol kinase (ATP)
MRARLIVNPASGSDRGGVLLARINAALRTVVRDLDITITTGPDEAMRAATRALEERCDALYVGGGDGTLNLVLRGLFAGGAGPITMPIGVIPLGTGNDFAKALGLGADPEGALEALLALQVVDVDVGTLNDRPFVNTSAGGFVADVSQAVTEGLKDVAGKLAYLIGGARALLGSEAFTARLTLPGKAGHHPGWAGPVDLEMFAICNARFIGGGRPIAPDALIDDGLLDVFVVRRMPLFEFVGVLQTIAAGEHTDDERVQHFRASAFDLEFDRVVRVNTDGELLQARSCAYRLLPRCVRFFCGASPFTQAAPRKSGRA